MDIRRRRRQVAWICFESYLTEEQMIEAIKILDRGFQVDGTMNMIAYVARICLEYGIDAAANKMLCNRFYKLMSDTTELLTIDPSTLILKNERLKQEQLKKEQLAKLESTVKQPPSPSPVANTAANNSLPIEPKESEQLPAHCVVFACFMRSVFEYTTDKKGLAAMLIELSTSKESQSQDLIGYILKWLNNTDCFLWTKNTTPDTLARLVHLVYMSLCEVMGPIVADDCFHRALKQSEQIPEARVFSPSQFL